MRWLGTADTVVGCNLECTAPTKCWARPLQLFMPYASCPRMPQLTPSSIVMQSVCIIQCIFQYAFRDTCKQGFVNAAVQRTTYQAGERLFGEFQCPQCHRKWASGNSWVNTRQECLNCRIMVSPHYQRRLDMPAQETYTRDLDKPHLTEMCEKCQQLGRDCSRRW